MTQFARHNLKRSPGLVAAKRFSIGAGTILWMAFTIGGAGCARLWGQAKPTVERSLAVAIFATGEIGNTRSPYYADNALGFNAGVLIQPFRFFGAEARGGAYPISDILAQLPVTAGLHIGPHQSRELQVLPFAYFGGGTSNAQAAAAGHYKTTPASWSPCWQASAGADLTFGKFAWRVYEASWTQTHTRQQDLRTLSFSTGVVYRFIR